MFDRMTLTVGALGLCLLGVGVWYFWPRTTVSADVVKTAYETPAPAPASTGVKVFHLGHSLVGRDMPAMLSQLAGTTHSYDSQLGWGTSLKQHWEPGEVINGFETENAHSRFQPAKEAIESGLYNTVVLTEMVEIRDAIKYHQSAKYLALWADLARASDPNTRIYLYESWHKLDDPDGWLERLDEDFDKYWVGQVLGPDLQANQNNRPVYIIPAGQVLAATVRAAEAADIGFSREDLFQVKEDGSLDPIHINDLGAYLVALTHYAVIYQVSPQGLPRQLNRSDGSEADAPSEALAELMQTVVWEVVQSRTETGVPR